MRRPLLAIAGGIVAFGAAGASPALANPIGMLTVSSGPVIQQTDNRPCVIGDPSCHNPASLPYTLLGPHDASDTVSSPTYTVDQIRGLVGNTFEIGLDLNQAMGQNGGAYDLNAFTLAVDGMTAFSTGGETTITPLSPGNGYSDATIATFDLTGLNGSDTLVFTTDFTGGTAGREQYFLSAVTPQGGGPGGSPTPEPASILLLGSGAVALLRRKRA